MLVNCVGVLNVMGIVRMGVIKMTESCTGKYYTKIDGEGWICNKCGFVDGSRGRVQQHALKCKGTQVIVKKCLFCGRTFKTAYPNRDYCCHIHEVKGKKK